MAEYIVTASNGKRYRVEGPEGAPEQLVKANVERQIAQRDFMSRPQPTAAPAAPERSTMLEEVKRSARGLASGARTGIEALLGDPEQSALEGIRRSKDITEDYGTAPSFAGLKDTFQNEGILAALGEGLSQVPRFASQQLPVLAQLAAAGKIGASLPLPPQLRPIAGAITAGASFIPSFTGSNLERLAEEQMASNEVVDVDLGGAALTATGQAATEALGGAAVLGKRIVSSLLGSVPKEAAEAELKRLASRGTLASIAAAAARGAAVEMPTEVIQSMLERNYAGLPLADEDAMREYGEAAYAAGLSGGAISGALGSRDGARARRELEGRQAPPPAEQAPADDTPPPAPPTVPGAEFAQNLNQPAGSGVSIERVNADEMEDPFAEGEPVVRGDPERPGLMPANSFVRNTGKKREKDVKIEGARPVTGDVVDLDMEQAPAQGDFTTRTFNQMPDASPFLGGKAPITRDYVNSLGIKYPAHKWVNDNLVGKTVDDVKQMVEQNPALLTTKGTRSDLLKAIIATPPAAATAPGMTPFAPVQEGDVVTPERDAQADPFAEGVEATVASAPGVATPTPNPFETGEPVTEQNAPGVAAPSADPFVSGLPATSATAPGVVSDSRVTQGVEVNDQTAPGVAAPRAVEPTALEQAPDGDVPTLRREEGAPQYKLMDGFEKNDVYDNGVIVDGVKRPAVNSRGTLIAESKEELVNFWRWFGDSKVVDDQGRPLVVYHGTPNWGDVGAYDSFNTEGIGVFGKGAYFTTSPRRASGYANKGPASNVYPVYLKIDTPLTAESLNANLSEFNKVSGRALERPWSLGGVTEALQRRGSNQVQGWINSNFDGVIERTGGGEKELVVFLPNQIKSAVGNKGTFDPAKPGIVDSGSIETKENSNATKEINRSFTRALNETNTSQELLGRMANDPLVPVPLRTLARALRSAAPNVNVPVNLTEMEGSDVVGQYVPPWEGTERIILDPRAGSVPQTYLHEFVHALTVRAIAEDTPAGKRVKVLFEQFKTKHPDVLDPDTGKMKPFMYGLKNAYEFVSEGLTNPNFQIMLKQKNLWERFVDVIRQLVGLPKTQNNILDELLDLTKEMAVGADARFIAKRNELADAFADSNNPAGNETFLRVQGEMLKDASVSDNDPKFKRTVSTLMNTGKSATRRVLAWGLPLPALNDYVQNHLKKKGTAWEPLADSVDRFTKIAHKMEGELEQFTVAITAQLARMGQWRNENPLKLKTLAEVYFGGRLAQIDITKPKSYYEGKKDEADMPPEAAEARKAKLKEYDRLQKLFVELGPAGQQVLRQMRAIHNGQFKKLSQMVYDRVYSDTQDRELATRLKNEFTKQMREKGPMEGYAAFQRPNGKYMLQYPVPGNPEPAFEIFTNEFDQKARMAQLEEDGVPKMDIKPFLGDNLKNFDGVVPTSFMGKLVQELKDSKLDKDSPAYKNLVESVMALGVSMSPSSLVLQRLAKSRNVPGYIQDPLAAFQEGTVGLGKRLVNLKYGAQLSNEIRDMQASRKNVGNDQTALDLVEEMTKRGQYALNPSHAAWSNAVSTATYGWTLGFNLSSAVVDMSALALVTAPFLAKFPGYNYGLAKTAGKISSSMRDIMGMGMTANVESLTTAGLEGKELEETLKLLGKKEGERDMIDRKTMPSMLNIDFTNPAQQQKYGHLEALVKKMQEYGHSERYSELSESVEFGEGNALSKWSARMGFMMSASERFKREVGIKAAYELELDRLAPNGKPTQAQMDAAADKAMEMSTLINGGSTAVTGAGFQRGDISRILMMYRRFAAGQLYLQGKMLGVAFNGATPQERAEMRAYMAYSMLTSAAFVGVKGMPMMGAAAGAYAVVMMLFGDEDEENSFEGMLRNNMDPIFVEGIPNILFNANVAGRMELTNLLIRNSSVRDGATFAEYAAAYLGGPAVGSMERIWRGARMVSDGDIQRGVENMLPVTLSNTLKSFRTGVEGEASTLRGDEVVPVTPGGALAQAMGFAPADYARAIEFNIKQSGVDRRMANRRTSLMEAVYIAYRAGDTEGVARAMQKIVEFNQRYPEYVLTSQGIRQSLSQRDRNTAKMVMGSLPAERRRDAWEEEAAAWGFE